MADKEIPTFQLDPDAAALIQWQHEIDHAEAGPKSAIPGFSYRGVYIESRWAVVRELEIMKRIIDEIPELTLRRLASIWCDSKCGASYVVSVCEGLWAPDLERAVNESVMTASSGHNGIAINEGDQLRAFIDPDWGEI